MEFYIPGITITIPEITLFGLAVWFSYSLLGLVLSIILFQKEKAYQESIGFDDNVVFEINYKTTIFFILMFLSGFFFMLFMVILLIAKTIYHRANPPELVKASFEDDV